MAASPSASRIVKLAADVICLALLTLSLCAGTISEEFEGFLLCRKCGHELSKVSDISNVPSSEAMSSRNTTFPGGRHLSIQLFKNPQGNLFEVITTSAADVARDERAFTEHSWFPGFQWTFCWCPQCHSHLGWLFSPAGSKLDGDSSGSFIGFILDRILHEKEAATIVSLPRAYSS